MIPNILYGAVSWGEVRCDVKQLRMMPCTVSICDMAWMNGLQWSALVNYFFFKLHILPWFVVVQIQSLSCDRERVSGVGTIELDISVRDLFRVWKGTWAVCPTRCVSGVRISIISVESREWLINSVVFHQEKCCSWKWEEIERIRWTSLS